MSDFSRDDLWAWVHGEEDNPARAAAIASAIASDPKLASEVEEMKALVEGLEDVALFAEEEPREPELPEWIGPYRIIRRLGAGGMGVVFEAEQQQPKRRVALKVIRGAARYDPVTVGLFQREVQALAQLEHASIAQIFEAGHSDDGEQFLVMELITGVTLDAYCLGAGDRVPDLRSRLQLMLVVCRAISHAHQRGVIHRDLKPANILVTSEGTPKILDFGLARLAEADADQLATLSQQGQVMGTLAYMSPEQARGDRNKIDLRTDVYGLGAILYEMVTGTLPHDVGSGSFFQIVQRITTASIPAPSHHNQRLPREIDAIILKALAPELDRRYTNAAELADDIECYLTNFPVKARRPNALYHLNLFVRRNRTAVILLSALFVSISAAAIGLGILSGKYLTERDNAIEAASKFKEMLLLQMSLLKAPNPWEEGAHDRRVTEVLDQASERIGLEVSDPEVEISLREILADTYRVSSKFEEARREWETVLALQRKLSPAPEYAIARSLVELGDLTYEHSGDPETTKSYLLQALMLLETAVKPPDAIYAQALNLRGVIARREGDLRTADEMLAAALKQRRELASRSVQSNDRKRTAKAYNDVAQTINNQAGVTKNRAEIAKASGDLVAATKAFQQARLLYEEGLQLREQWQPPNHPDIAKMCNNLSLILAEQGDFVAAEKYLRRTLEILMASVGATHQYTARTHYNLSRLLVDMGKFDQARLEAQRAAEIQAVIFAPEHPQRQATAELLHVLSEPTHE